mmetsp:Transcript_34956/g.62834  ORF Transcript_34956/g.62834 Transcript_34956/m.62834 type:complete len:130 (+) Transcript_34956:786-1175(+)
MSNCHLLEDAELGVSLIKDDVTGVIHVMVLGEGPEKRRDKVKGEKALALFGLAVVGSENGLYGLGSLGEVVVRNLGEEMVDKMSADIVVNLVENTIITVKGREAAAKVAPLFAAVPRHFDTTILGTVVV